MKAMVADQNGNMKITDVQEPQPGVGEVKIMLKAAGINHRDLSMRKIGGPAKTGSYIPGSDGAGTLVEVGEGVSTFQNGDQVLICPISSCGRCAYCLDGKDSYCDAYQIIDGTYAEYMTVPARSVYPIVPGLSMEEAASFPLASLTAWHMLVSRARVQATDTVLIWGAGSGVGMYGLQIAKQHGARVIAVASTDEKMKNWKRRSNWVQMKPLITARRMLYRRCIH